MSLPPPSSRPPDDAAAPEARARREVLLRLDAGKGKGWRRRPENESAGIRLAGTLITFEHETALAVPLTIPVGTIAVASVDRGRSPADGDHGRFPILRRMSPTAVVPVEEGQEGWLWTSRSGSMLPMLGEGAPNLALVFVTPLDDDLARGCFRPAFLAALAARSPLGTPTVFGLIARVADPGAAEAVFRGLGLDRPLTDREVAPAQRRHLPTDRPADPPIASSRRPRGETSVPPPDARGR